MKKKIISIVSISILILFFNTCASDVYNPDVCFQQNVLPIFVSKCSMNGCHNSKDKEAEYDFSTYEGIMKGVKAKHPLQSEVYNVIKGNNPSMPIDGKLTAKEISYIKIWIKMGAKNTSNCSSCDTTNVTYSGRISPLLNVWCVGCHNSNNAGGGFDLSTYAGVVNSITQSRLLGSIKHASGFSAMPQNTNKLSDCDISAVEKWVNNGYPNN
jgi:cytochrome c553